MFGRIFGRGKDDRNQAVCAECGRTLLAGEWTQTIVDERGNERLICSLCGQAYAGVAEPVAAAPAPANNGRVRETRSEARQDQSAPQTSSQHDRRAQSEAFWIALKEKDAQIERLKAELARAEAERQELAGRFARLGTSDESTEAGAVAGASAVGETETYRLDSLEAGEYAGDSSEPGERTWGETPAEFAAEMAALTGAESTGREVAAAESGWPMDAEERQDAAEEPERQYAEAERQEEPQPLEAAWTDDAEPAGEPEIAVTAMPATVFEDTQPIQVGDELLDHDDDASTGEIAAAEAAAAVAAAARELPVEPPAQVSPAEAALGEGPAVEESPTASAAELEAAASSLTLLQRGVDLLNVSRVPRKIAETNEQLGLPHVHVGFDGEIVAVTFMWTMGWYRFRVELDTGNVGMHDRGYDELSLQPNAGVRADGTVQLAPAQISRAAAQRVQAAPAAASQAAPQAGPQAAAPEPETPREAAQKPPEFLSKSLLGQRSDDETASWEQTKARDFDWER